MNSNREILYNQNYEESEYRPKHIPKNINGAARSPSSKPLPKLLVSRLMVSMIDNTIPTIQIDTKSNRINKLENVDIIAKPGKIIAPIVKPIFSESFLLLFETKFSPEELVSLMVIFTPSSIGSWISIIETSIPKQLSHKQFVSLIVQKPRLQQVL